MTYLDWHVGMKVVCDDADRCWHDGLSIFGEKCPTVGATYTIREIFICPRSRDVGIRLHEIVNPQCKRSVADQNGSTELGFRASLFRPVQPRATDISIFTAMLTGAKTKERA